MQGKEEEEERKVGVHALTWMWQCESVNINV